MRFPSPLVPARLIRRYKRFLSDVVLEEDGREVVAHCPNPGAMLGLAEQGSRIWLETNDDPRKKLKFGWRLSELQDGHYVGIDTSIPNRVIGEALRSRQIGAFEDYSDVRTEVPYSRNSRIDFLLSQAGAPDVYVEVKNAHLRRSGTLAEFPDCVTARGAKHLGDLAAMVEAGARAVMLYLVQRTDCTAFSLAADLDPKYAEAFEKARAAGVEVLVYSSEISTLGVELGAPLPFVEFKR